MGGSAKSKKTLEERVQELEDRVAQAELKELADRVRLWIVEQQQAAMQQRQMLEGEKLKALSFVTDQFAQRTIRFGLLQRSVTLASNNYYEILNAESVKTVSWSVLATFVAFSALPEFAALGVVVKELQGFAGDLRNTVNRFTTALKTVGKSLDGTRMLLDKQVSGTKGYSAANVVLQDAYDLTLQALSLEGRVLQEVMLAILSDSMGSHPMSTMMTFWGQAGLQFLNSVDYSTAQSDSDTLSKMLLYDILHQYTRQYVRMNISDYQTDDLKTVSNSDVDVNGLNSGQREEIYKRFSTVPWKWAQPSQNGSWRLLPDSRPTIVDWRDIARFWDARVVFTGPDGPD